MDVNDILLGSARNASTTYKGLGELVFVVLNQRHLDLSGYLNMFCVLGRAMMTLMMSLMSYAIYHCYMLEDVLRRNKRS